MLYEWNTNSDISLLILNCFTSNTHKQESKELATDYRILRNAFINFHFRYCWAEIKYGYLFEDKVQVILQLNRCVWIVELTEHYTLRCNHRTEQLDYHICIDLLTFNLHRIKQLFIFWNSIRKTHWTTTKYKPHHSVGAPVFSQFRTVYSLFGHSTAWILCHFVDQTQTIHSFYRMFWNFVVSRQIWKIYFEEM